MPRSVTRFPDAPGCRMLGIVKPVDWRLDSDRDSKMGWDGGQQPTLMPAQHLFRQPYELQICMTCVQVISDGETPGRTCSSRQSCP